MIHDVDLIWKVYIIKEFIFMDSFLQYQKYYMRTSKEFRIALLIEHSYILEDLLLSKGYYIESHF